MTRGGSEDAFTLFLFWLVYFLMLEYSNSVKIEYDLQGEVKFLTGGNGCIHADTVQVYRIKAREPLFSKEVDLVKIQGQRL